MLIPAEVWTVAKTDRGNAVLLKPKNKEEAVPIFIGTAEAQNILLGMGDVDIPRPLTHDLILSVLEMMDAKLIQVEIHSMIDGTFFSNLQLTQGSKKITIDARPSDALALAVRRGCPILIEEAIVEEASIALSQEEIPQEESPPDAPAPPIAPPPSPSKALRAKELAGLLERAVEEENYEEAAKIRDQIQQLEAE